MYANKNNSRSWPGMLAKNRMAGACFCSRFVEKLSDSPRGRPGCSGTATGFAGKVHQSPSVPQRLHPRMFLLKTQPAHRDGSAPVFPVLGDLLALRGVPVGTGLGDHNEEGSSRGVPRSSQGTSWTFGCSDIHLVLVLCSLLRPAVLGWRFAGGDSQEDKSWWTRGALPACPQPEEDSCKIRSGVTSCKTTRQSLHPALPRHRQG